MKKIMLNKENLTDLMRGKILDFSDVQIALSDIGFGEIEDAFSIAVAEAMIDSLASKDHLKLVKD